MKAVFRDDLYSKKSVSGEKALKFAACKFRRHLVPVDSVDFAHSRVVGWLFVTRMSADFFRVSWANSQRYEVDGEMANCKPSHIEVAS
jgi:hypothetical protein